MPFVISKEIEFDAGHRVPLHESKCKNPHGHRYKVVVTVEGPLQEEGSSAGMVTDFSFLKKLLQDYVHDVYDHGFIVWWDDIELKNLLVDNGWKTIVVPFHPTAENLAYEIYDILRFKIPNWLSLVRVDVWETPTSMATFFEA